AGARRGVPQRQAGGAGGLAHHVQGAPADAAGGRVDGALEGGVVGAVGDQAHVGQRVLDLGALEEAHAAIHAVRDLFGQQLLFQRARLGVGAVQDGAVAVAATVAHPLVDALDHEAGLVDLVVGGVQVHRLALPAVGPQALAQSVGVVGDDGVGGLEDVGAGAVVLLQADGLRAGEVLEELLHVLHLGAAPAVDGLVVVADHEHLPAVAGQYPDEGVLDGVGVL